VLHRRVDLLVVAVAAAAARVDDVHAAIGPRVEAFLVRLCAGAGQRDDQQQPHDRDGAP